MDASTRREIERLAAETLRDAGITEPPVSVEQVLEHLSLYRDYYNLSDPGFLDRAKYKLKIQGRRLVDIIHKVRLQAVLLFDEGRICIDSELPKIKRPWASCHEAAHRIFPWHRPYFYADTAAMLDPAWQEALEQEANYGAARLLFLGEQFSRDSRDVAPTLEGLKALGKRYSTSLTTTIRRYVEQGPDAAMALLVSTPPWSELPEGQEHRWRHFVPSPRFSVSHPAVDADRLCNLVDRHSQYRRGGPVADFEFSQEDARGDRQLIRAWSFNNQHDLLTLFVEGRRVVERPVFVRSGSMARRT